MSKSKKSKKSRKQNKKSRKHLRNHLRNHVKKENSIKIDNTGLTEFIYKEGKQSPKKTVFEWNGNYDGENAKIHMDLDMDGKKTKTDLKLSNKDLMNILASTAAVNQPLDERLQALDNDLSVVYPSNPVIIHSGEMPMPLENEIFASPMISETPMAMQMISETPMAMSNSSVKKMNNTSKSRRKVRNKVGNKSRK
jgi:hypothetical protein